jgi:hypothetical protein
MLERIARDPSIGALREPTALRLNEPAHPTAVPAGLNASAPARPTMPERQMLAGRLQATAHAPRPASPPDGSAPAFPLTARERHTLHPFTSLGATAGALARRALCLAVAVLAAATTLGATPGLAAAGVPPNAWSDPVAYVTQDGFNRVVYRATDDSIRELYYNYKTGGSWGQANLSALAKAPKADHVGLFNEFNASPRAYATPDFARVIYRGDDEHVHELYYKKDTRTKNASGTDWGHADLNVEAKAPTARAVDDPFGYYFDGFARVVYRDADGHIHELAYKKGSASVNANGSDWLHTDLTARYRGSLAGGPPTAFVTDKTARIVYRGTDGHVNELRYTPSTSPAWVPSDLTQRATAGVLAAPAASDPTGYYWDGYARVVYRGYDDAIHELAVVNGTAGESWQEVNLTSLTGAPKAHHGASPRAYTTKDDGFARVIYRDDDEQIHELNYKHGSGWGHSPLRFSPPSVGDPFGYDTPNDGQNLGDPFTRVVYRTRDGHIHEQYYEKAKPEIQWREGDLFSQSTEPASTDRRDTALIGGRRPQHRPGRAAPPTRRSSSKARPAHRVRHSREQLDSGCRSVGGGAHRVEREPRSGDQGGELLPRRRDREDVLAIALDSHTTILPHGRVRRTTRRGNASIPAARRQSGGADCVSPSATSCSG